MVWRCIWRSLITLAHNFKGVWWVRIGAKTWGPAFCGSVAEMVCESMGDQLFVGPSRKWFVKVRGSNGALRAIRRKLKSLISNTARCADSRLTGLRPTSFLQFSFLFWNSLSLFSFSSCASSAHRNREKYGTSSDSARRQLTRREPLARSTLTAVKRQPSWALHAANAPASLGAMVVTGGTGNWFAYDCVGEQVPLKLSLVLRRRATIEYGKPRAVP